MKPRASGLAVLISALALGGCGSEAVPTPFSVWLPTETAPSRLCMQALGTGRLARDTRSGLGIVVGDDRISVMWPFRYSAVYEDGATRLIDPAGVPIASEGDVIQMSGGSRDDGLFYACAGSVERVQ